MDILERLRWFCSDDDAKRDLPAGMLVMAGQAAAEITRLHAEVERLRAENRFQSFRIVDKDAEIERLRGLLENSEMTVAELLGSNEQQRPRWHCEACGTLTTDRNCDCTRYGRSGPQKLTPYVEQSQHTDPDEGLPTAEDVRGILRNRDEK